MLEKSKFLENRNDTISRLKKRGKDFSERIDELALLYGYQTKDITRLENLRAEQNQISSKINACFNVGDNDKANQLIKESLVLKANIKNVEGVISDFSEKIDDVRLDIPNVPHYAVPAGAGENDNEVVRSGGQIPELGENAVPHWDLADQYQLIDFELGVKVTGAGFPVYTGKGAQLQRALINFFLSEANAQGYREIMPPLLVNADSGFGTGQLPDKEGQMYHVTADDLYLIPTAEVPLTNLYRDVILDEKDFPVKLCGYTPCFRREAGSYGKDVRGLNRLHQFDKVEIVQLVHPDNSYEVLETMTKYVEGLLQKLELPYRVLKLCGGDLGFASAMTYDMEVYSAAQKRWLEVSSISNFETFQSNRLKLRYKGAETKKPVLAHTLNGSALALPRIVASLLENNQSQNEIRIPEVLVPFTGFKTISK